MEGKAFEQVLPEDYAEVLSVDAKNDKKLIVLVNIIAFVIMAIIVAAAYLIIRPQNFFENYSFIRNIAFMVVLLLYIVLHELTHGIAYKSLTHEKLTFGMTLTVAYCGVPNIYVYRRTAMISLLAPFFVFTLLFGAAMFLFADPWDKMYVAVVFACHLGGCAGDLYDTFLFLTKLRDSRILMKDTGPKQTFYASTH